jgi:release factor glutamine methyltransferase
MMLENMPDHSLDGIYILFPDPWHKRRYLKKRLVNKDRLDIFKIKLKVGGFIAFASDIEDYFEDVKELFMQDNQLIINTNFLSPHEGYITTKYHQKAIKENRLARFIQAKLISL